MLLGCALIADESEESFTWLFQTWLRAMSGRLPLTVIADQDIAIQRAIAKVFPVTHHRFSLWQIKAKEQENMGLMGNDFTKDYENCVYQSQTVDEFDAFDLLFLFKLLFLLFLLCVYGFVFPFLPFVLVFH